MSPEPERKKRNPWIILLGWALSLGLLGLAFYVVPVREVWEAIRRASLPVLAAGSLIVSFSIILRGWRLAAILRVRAEHVSVFECWRIVSAGLAINGVVPGRIGDFVRIGMTMRSFKLDTVFVLTTIILERFLDGVTLLSFVVVAFMVAGIEMQQGSADVMGDSVSAEQLVAAMKWLALTVCLIFVGLVLLSREKVIAFLLKCARAVPLIGRHLSKFAGNAMDTLAHTVNTLRKPRTLVKLGVLCLGIWLPLVACNYLVAYGFEGMSLTIGQALTVTAVSIAVSSLPSAPGAWGVFEAGVFLVLKAMKLPVDDATIMAFAFTTHACQYLMVMLLGVVAFVSGGRESRMRSGEEM